MHICFLMYPWERVCPETDTTLRLVHECAARGHTVAITTTSGLTIRDSTVYGFCNVIKKVRRSRIISASVVSAITICSMSL